jgi:polysaccharide pyruvyl transferase CsaB
VTNLGIIGSYGGLNQGDEAILTAMAGSLRDRLPGASLTVFSRNAEHTSAHHDVDAVVPARALTREEVTRHVEHLDMLVVGGGGILHDGEAQTYLREAQLAQRLGIPTMTYAVGAGPLGEPDDVRCVRETLERMDAVTVRDAGAKRILEDAGVDCRIEVTADPALLLPPEPVPPLMLRAEGVRGGRPLVGMSIRERGPAAPDLDPAAYNALLAQTADYVVERFGATVLFVPMEPHDVRLAHGVISSMASAHHARVLTGGYRPGELLGLMGHLEMVVAMRLHLLMFAAVAGVPLMPLPYAAKVEDFVASISAPSPRGMDCSAGTLLAAVDRVWDLRHEAAALSRPHVERLRERARRTLDIAASCLRPPLADKAAA